MGEEVLIFITAATQEEASRIGKILVQEHLAACVNIVSGIQSIFFWETKVQEETEALLLCKSRLPLMEKLTVRVKSLHSYTVPEIIAIPIVAGSQEYLHWIQDATRND